MLILEHELRWDCVEMWRKDGWSTRRRSSVVVRWLDIITEVWGRTTRHTQVRRYQSRRSRVLVVLLWRICSKIDEGGLTVARRQQLWSVPIHIRLMSVGCMMCVRLLHRRAGAVLEVAICSPPPSKDCASGLIVRHDSWNTVAFCQVLKHHPRVPNVLASSGRVTQILLEDDLGVEALVSLDLRGPVLDNLLIGVVQRDFVRVGADRVVH